CRWPDFGLLVRQVLADHAYFGECLAVVELQRWNIPFEVDFPVIIAALGFLVGNIDLDQVEIDPGLAGNNMWRHRAGTGRVEKFHDFLSLIRYNRARILAGDGS